MEIPVEERSVLKSKGVVDHIMTYNGKFLVAFPKYAGYFKLDDPAMQEKVRQAQLEGREVSFTFDRNFKIISMQEI